ncbi:MAG: bstEII, partial [Phycisphaerae bacterium]|nr:bstEII [Phycisphaerae bacterium]
ACELYKPVLVLFGQLLKSSESSTRLLLQIAEQPDGWMRIQLARVFRKYVSPVTPVEMLKHKSKAQTICDQFGKDFRPIHQVQAAFSSRPIPDEALCAVLWEYKDRGKKGYDLTERFFILFRSVFPDMAITGPERAGKDILLGDILDRYPTPDRPVDFVIYDKPKGEILAIGLAHYDSDRGGSQEDRGPASSQTVADEILRYATKRRLRTKVILLNDGPGLLLGSMWRDHANLERGHRGRVLVTTLRMVSERITREWLLS